MPMGSSEATTLLCASANGDAQAASRMLPRIYEELKRIARLRRSRERADLTLSTEGLVHEAYLKLINNKGLSWRDEQHFVALASRAIRQVLIDYARARNRTKRRGRSVHLHFDDEMMSEELYPEYLVSLNEALKALADYDLNLATLIELRFFGGMTVAESAAFLGLSQRSAERNWTRAKAFMMAHMTDSFK